MCWKEDPKERPEFTEILEKLNATKTRSEIIKFPVIEQKKPLEVPDVIIYN